MKYQDFGALDTIISEVCCDFFHLSWSGKYELVFLKFITLVTVFLQKCDSIGFF